MFRCPKCDFELPDNANFCNNCGLSQTNPLLMAMPRVQKGQRITKPDKEQVQPTPRIPRDNDASATIKAETVRPVRTNRPTRNRLAMQTPSLEARFTQST